MAERATASLVICAPAKLPAIFDDDLDGTCAICQQPIRFRPHLPAVRVLVCLECFIVRAEPGAKVQLLDEAAAELEARGLNPPPW
jgi:hypothetical protein